MRRRVRLHPNTTSPIIPIIIIRTPIIRITALASSASEGPTLGSLPVSLTREATLSVAGARSVAGVHLVGGTHRVVVKPKSVARLQSLATRPPAQMAGNLVTFSAFDTSNLVEDHAAVSQCREVRTMKKLTVALVAMLILGLSASAYAGISVGFGVQQIVPEPIPIPPPAYAYPYPYPYPYPVPGPYYYPAPRYYGPRVYAAPPPVLFDFGIRFGDRGHGRHFEHRWH
jgi:hypothetical protein